MRYIADVLFTHEIIGINNFSGYTKTALIASQIGHIGSKAQDSHIGILYHHIEIR